MIGTEFYINFKEELRRILPSIIFHFFRHTKNAFIAPYEVPRLWLRSKRLDRYNLKPREIIFRDISFNIIVSKENGMVDNEIALKGIWEPYICECLYLNLRKGDVFLDLGANIGFFSLMAARLVGEKGKIIALEPYTKLVTQFKKSVAANNMTNISIHPVACGDTVGTKVLHLRGDNIGGSTLRPVEDDVRFSDQKNETIDTVRLDDLLATETRIDFVKIDVEGYELHALKGMVNLIEKHRPKLLIEFTPEFYATMEGDITNELLEFLRERNYSFFTTTGEPINEETLSKITKQIDVLCVSY